MNHDSNLNLSRGNKLAFILANAIFEHFNLRISILTKLEFYFIILVIRMNKILAWNI